MDENELYVKAISMWGKDAQIDMAVEEMGELLTALARFNRGRISENMEEVQEEIADVMIMCEQLAMIFGRGAVLRLRGKKLSRLEGRILESFHKERHFS